MCVVKHNHLANCVVSLLCDYIALQDHTSQFFLVDLFKFVSGPKLSMNQGSVLKGGEIVFKYMTWRDPGGV